MGGPLSSIISEIFLQHLDSQNIENLKKKYNISFYGRFVDDILIVYDGTMETSQNILTDFNKINSNINYTLEIEKKHKIL